LAIYDKIIEIHLGFNASNSTLNADLSDAEAVALTSVMDIVIKWI
jgi:hypothetical protein